MHWVTVTREDRPLQNYQMYLMHYPGGNSIEFFRSSDIALPLHLLTESNFEIAAKCNPEL
jgi:hypothetical protein